MVASRRYPDLLALWFCEYFGGIRSDPLATMSRSGMPDSILYS
jgi:hypothetical protein